MTITVIPVAEGPTLAEVSIVLDEGLLEGFVVRGFTVNLSGGKPIVTFPPNVILLSEDYDKIPTLQAKILAKYQEVAGV